MPRSFRFPWQAPVVSTSSSSDGPNSLVASAVIHNNRERLYIQNEPWQNEVWNYLDTLGEFRFAVDWRSNAISRIRLRAARTLPGQDEPEIIDSGPAVDLMNLIGGDVGGRSQMMKTFSQLLDVPGECWLVGEQIYGVENWTVRSADELHAYGGKSEVIDEQRSSDSQTIWRLLGAEQLIIRIWRPHPRYKHMADSPARAARHTMRELELVNRKIQAQYLSRLASAGLLIFPEEITFPVRPEFEDLPNPFVAEFIEMAKEAIATPGTASAIIPIPIQMAGEYVDKVKYLDLTPASDEKIIEKRESAMRKLALELDLPVEIILGTGSRSNHWCVDNKTEIMTTRGWLHQDQLKIGDTALTLNHETGLSEWQPVQDIYRANVVNEPMLSLEGRSHSSLTTMNHRWPILQTTQAQYNRQKFRTWTTSAELKSTQWMLTAAPSGDAPTDAKWSDAFAELIGWFFTEGSIKKQTENSQPMVSIYQSHTANLDNVVRIRRALTTLYGPAHQGRFLGSGGRTSDKYNERRSTAKTLRASGMSYKKIGEYFEVSDKVAYSYVNRTPIIKDTTPHWKETIKADGRMTIFTLNIQASAPFIEIAPNRMVSLDFIRELTLAQLELFISTAIRGDGTIGKVGGQRSVGQKDPKMLEAAELACILAGYTPYIYSYETTGFTRHTCWNIGVNKRTVFGPKKKHKSIKQYTGIVYCPTTKNGTWLGRRNGSIVWEGNSAWQVEESAIKVHLLPTVELICQALTYGYLHPRLIADGEDIGNLVVWYDTSELVLRPDRSALARDAYDRTEINPKAYRQAIGFDESAKPSDTEAVAMLLKVAARNPTIVFEALNQLVPGSVEVPTTSPAVSGVQDTPEPSEQRKTAHERGRPKPKDDDPPHDKTGGSPGAHQSPTTIPLLVIASDVEDHLLDINALTKEWKVLHPKTCMGSKHQCPVTWTGFQHSGIAPGTSGVYTLGCSDGKLELGDRILPDSYSNGHVSSRVR